MGKKGHNTRTKRSKAPAFWKVPRKQNKFIISTSPGPHPIWRSYPLGVLLRDILKVTYTQRETRTALLEGKVPIDGVVRKSTSFPVGLMDVIEIPSSDKVYRMVPKDGNPLEPIEIPKKEKDKKLCKVVSKVTIRGAKVQYGFHDSNTVIGDGSEKIKPGDTCVFSLSSRKILKTFGFDKGALALITKGVRAGLTGKIEELIPGNVTNKSYASINLEEGTVKLPTDLLFIVGTDSPTLVI